MGLTLTKYQIEAGKTAEYENQGNNWEYPLLGLGGEVGEIQNKMKKILRGDYDLAHAKKLTLGEIGDVLWYVAIFCNEMGWSLEVVAEMNLEKLAERKRMGTIQGSGDDR